MADYETLILEREIAAPPGRVFDLLTDRGARERWAAPDESSVVIIDYFDCRPGGREEIRCGPKAAPEFETTGLFHVVTPEFLSFTETLSVGGKVIAAALCGHEISQSGAGARLCVTLQITSLAGPGIFGDYRNGWSAALDNLAAMAVKG